MSSCEGFLLMARALPTVTTYGVRSRGASANPRPLAVLPDLTLWSSTWRTYPPDSDTTIEGVGVAPEIEVAEAPSKGRDPVLEAALRALGPEAPGAAAPADGGAK
jgi:C-terminal processing protease CtpA/Prc